MLFRRRGKPTFAERLRTWAWPRVSWRRSARYVTKRTLRLAGTPHSIAVGAAVGAGAACTPLLGMHLALAIAAAWIIRGNLVAAGIGTMIGNPLTFPLLWGASYELGRLLLGEAERGRSDASVLAVDPVEVVRRDLAGESWSRLWPMLEPIALGSIVIGAAVGCAIYLIVYKAVFAYQAARRARFARRRGSNDAGGTGARAAEAGRDT